MKADADVIAALDACLKYERTIADCFKQYQRYFRRWRINGCKRDCKGERKAAEKRVVELMDRINLLDAIPGQEMWEIEVETIERASDINKFIGYFLKMLAETRGTYEKSRMICMEAGDVVSAKLCGCLKGQIEVCLGRFEAKQRKVQLIGDELYIAIHLHN